ncbi:MAG: isocitrate dehydrogenase (NADP(+)) [Peptococcaceae bacterium]|jgi:isocitrate dehydrogenase|nr:isocitrate dehydrogenase (NADP(+)) [Peptococcaceae bacterium]MDH7524806.1 isocitrate dehydrogenase (NADP(+)) [Peptococcaceae bacterium]
MGEKITVNNGKLNVPDRPVIVYIEGDGTGPDIWRATRRVVDAAVAKAYGGQKSIAWKEALAGEKAFRLTGDWLPPETLETIREYAVAIKGPLTTPVGEGFRSLNVALRQELDLYACVRPVRWIKGVPSPVVHPEWVDVVIFRENTEDVYAGIEWERDSAEAGKVRRFLNEEMNCGIPGDAGIGIKYMGQYASERIMRKAMRYALENNRRRVTVVHKGNIMKYTEGSFKNWCYGLAKREFGGVFVTEDELAAAGGRIPEGKILLNDRIADNMLQQLVTRSNEYEILVCPNLNGDYISDAAAALVGGLGMAPGGNISDSVALFEATHGTAPKYANQDKANPSSLILSAVMMLEHIGWKEAAARIEQALEKTIQERKVTYDLARQMKETRELTTSEFARAVIENM